MAVGVVVEGDISISAMGAILGCNGIAGAIVVIAAGIIAAPGKAGVVEQATDRNPTGIAAGTDAAAIKGRRAACISVTIISAAAKENMINPR